MTRSIKMQLNHAEDMVNSGLEKHAD